MIVSAAAFGLVAANPAFASAANRSADALPIKAASAASVPYSEGLENTWQCNQVDNQFVRVDQTGRMVVNGQGAPFRCAAPASSYAVGSAGFPFAIVGGMLGVGGLIIAIASKKKDSPG